MKGSYTILNKSLSCDYSAQERLLQSEQMQPPFYSLWVIDDIKAAPQTLQFKTLASSSSTSLVTEEWWSSSSGLKKKSALMSSPLMRWQERFDHLTHSPPHLSLSVFLTFFSTFAISFSLPFSFPSICHHLHLPVMCFIFLGYVCSLTGYRV